MKIQVTQEDIDAGKKHVKNYETNNINLASHCPIALAMYRVFGKVIAVVPGFWRYIEDEFISYKPLPEETNKFIDDFDSRKFELIAPIEFELELK